MPIKCSKGRDEDKEEEQKRKTTILEMKKEKRVKKANETKKGEPRTDNSRE